MARLRDGECRVQQKRDLAVTDEFPGFARGPCKCGARREQGRETPRHEGRTGSRVDGFTRGWIAVPLFWWGGALWTVASLVALAPRRRMAACVMRAVTGETLLIGFGGSTVWHERCNTGFIVFCSTGLAGPVPLLVGGTVGRRLTILCGIPTLEQHR